jgi:hypothetical protein
VASPYIHTTWWILLLAGHDNLYPQPVADLCPSNIRYCVGLRKLYRKEHEIKIAQANAFRRAIVIVLFYFISLSVWFGQTNALLFKLSAARSIILIEVCVLISFLLNQNHDVWAFSVLIYIWFLKSWTLVASNVFARNYSRYLLQVLQLMLSEYLSEHEHSSPLRRSGYSECVLYGGQLVLAPGEGGNSISEMASAAGGALDGEVTWFISCTDCSSISYLQLSDMSSATWQQQLF